MNPALRAVLLTPPFTPARLFRGGEQGWWFELASNFEGLYQDSTGVTPVTAVEQPVGLHLDKRFGLVRGSELVTNGGLNSDTGWTKGAGWAISGGTAVATASSANLSQALAVTANKSYEISFTTTYTGGTLLVRLGGAIATYYSQAGTYRGIAVCGSGNQLIEFVGTGLTATIDNISVREIPGNHRLQATSASRPTLSARYNRLTYSEDISNAAWTKTRTSAASASELREDTTAGATHELTVGGTSLPANTSMQFYAEVKPNGRSVIGISNTSNATQRAEFTLTGAGSASVAGAYSAGVNASVSGLSITVLSDGFYAVSVTIMSSVGSNFAIYLQSAGGVISYNGDGASGVLIRKIDLRLSADTTGKGPAYQRVDTATSYDTNGFLVDQDLDGVDDSFSGSTGGGGTTGFFYCAAHRIDGGAGTVRTLFSDRGTNTGYRVCINASNKLELSAGNGSAFTAVESAATLSVGSTYVISAWHDGVNLYVQINQGAIASTAFATATAGSASFTVGKSNTAASEFLNGLLYGDIYVLNGGVSDSNRTKTQRWLANKAGVTL